MNVTVEPKTNFAGSLRRRKAIGGGGYFSRVERVMWAGEAPAVGTMLSRGQRALSTLRRASGDAKSRERAMRVLVLMQEEVPPS